MPSAYPRPLDASDIPHALELCRLAEWNQVRADWDYFLAHARCFAVEHDQQILGTCAVLDPAGPVAWISMMLVHPAARRQSIGTRLFEHTLAQISAPSIGLDATALGKPLYEKYSFVPVAEVVRLKVDSLIRPQYPPSAAPCRAGHSANQIGPIYAGSVDKAIPQALNCLATRPRDSWIIDVPRQAPATWFDWLHAQGFTPQRPLIRMYRGEPQPVAANLFATSGPEYGHHSRCDI